ncbi:hypothetical protein CsSME_00021861 [Camellia sinensis var. sinensis]
MESRSASFFEDVFSCRPQDTVPSSMMITKTIT